VKLLHADPEDLSETEHQKLCVKYTAQLGLGPYLIAIPNGTQLAGGPQARARYMASLKAMGLKPGASDLFLAKPVASYHGAWFEMKRVKRSSTSSAQVTFLTNMHQQGYYVDVCAGFDAFRASLFCYLRGGSSAWVAAH
jgi:hypothetical protein